MKLEDYREEEGYNTVNTRSRSSFEAREKMREFAESLGFAEDFIRRLKNERQEV